MPVIAVVGEWNQATKMMKTYLEEIIQVQQQEPVKAILTKKMTERYRDGSYGYPDFQFMNFTDTQELFDYTSAEDYV